MPQPLARMCRILYDEADILRSLLSRTPLSARKCRRYMARYMEMFTLNPDKSKLDAICASLLTPGADRGAACEMIFEAQGFPVEKRRRQAADCVQALEFRYDLKDPCAPPEDSGRLDAVVCEWMEGYRRALKSGDAKACGGAPLCLALMGRGERACGAYLKRIRDPRCKVTPTTARPGIPRPP